MASGSKLFGFQGGLAEIRNHRTASAPYSWMTSNGSTVFPFDFDIFCSLAIQNHVVDDNVLKTRFAEQMAADDVQCVKPAACLIHAFGNEIGGEGVLENILVFERVVPLGKGHRSRIETRRPPPQGCVSSDHRRHNPTSLRPMYGLCRSSGSGRLCPCSRSSATLPTERCASQDSQTQIGIGVPPIAVARDRPGPCSPRASFRTGALLLRADAS